jgi:very-short-patch-repair endonuclease
VYAVGHLAIGRHGRWAAAVLAAGEGAVLSHRSAACLWGMLDQSVEEGMEVTVPRSSRSTARVRRHHGHLRLDEVVIQVGIPVTCVARTLFDVAACLPAWKFERALREAEVLRLPQRPSLADLYVRHPRRRGAKSVRRTLEALSQLPGGHTRSAMEDRFLRFLASRGLPLPETNARLKVGVRRYEVDCLWRTFRLIVELDGHEAHGTRSAFEGDRERDRRLQAVGWRVIRVTWRQLTDQPEALAHDLRRIFGHQSASAPTE